MNQTLFMGNAMSNTGKGGGGLTPVSLYCWESLKKHLFIHLFMHFHSRTTQTEIAVSFLYYDFYILYLLPVKLLLVSDFLPRSKLFQNVAVSIQKVMFHFRSSTCVQAHTSLVDPASNSFFKVTQNEHIWFIWKTTERF